jgi:AcrR family transcriptional regulator
MGYAEASMEDIARAAGITKPVLYDHFKSKEALFAAVLERVRDRLLAEGEKASQAPFSRDLQVRAAVEGFLSLAEASPDDMRVLVAIHPGDSSAAAIARVVQSTAVLSIAAMLKRNAPNAPEWTLSAASEVVLSSLHAIALWWLDNRTVEKKALVDLIATILWNGISAIEARPLQTKT